MTDGAAQALPTSGAGWSEPELQKRLEAAGIAADVVVPVKVTVGDINPAAARRRAERARSRWIRVIFPALVLLAAALYVVRGAREGFGSLTGLFLLQLTAGPLANWRNRPRLGAVAAGTQAESFVVALRTPTNMLHAIQRRWLIFHGSEQRLVTQEERWDLTGSVFELKVRWPESEARISGIGAVAGRFGRRRIRLEFSDRSEIVLDPGSDAVQRLLDYARSRDELTGTG